MTVRVHRPRRPSRETLGRWGDRYDTACQWAVVVVAALIAMALLYTVLVAVFVAARAL